jgi:hypothetical protein
LFVHSFTSLSTVTLPGDHGCMEKGVVGVLLLR